MCHIWEDSDTFILDKMPRNNWHLLLELCNDSFDTGLLPRNFKKVQTILLAKKESICMPKQIRSISLPDSLLKVQEKLFLTRFMKKIATRRILPDNQSGFHPDYPLQTKVLLLIEQISAYMSNSALIATVFFDFKSA